jgi:hypothetical protein
MAVVNVSSTTVTNLNASPSVLGDIRNSHGRLHVKTETVDMAAADDNGSTYRLFRVKSSDSIKSIMIFTPGIAGTTDIDVGLYTINGGAVVDADLYCDDVDLTTAAPPAPSPTAAAPDGIECRFGDEVTSLPSFINNKVWQDLGLTADPNLSYDVVLTANAAASAAGTVAVRMIYTAGD